MSSFAIDADALARARAAGHVNTQGEAGTRVGLSETSLESQEEHAKLLQRFEAEQRARSIVVPTQSGDVRDRLRALHQPIRLFGEGLADIRERLRKLLGRMEIDGEHAALAASAGASAAATEADAARPKKDVYSAATPELLAARREMSGFSFPRAAARLAGAKRAREVGDATTDLENDVRARPSPLFAASRLSRTTDDARARLP